MSVELRPYSTAKAMRGATLMTRDFRPVTFLEYNPKLQESVRVRVQIKGLSTPTTYFETGRRLLEQETKVDLFIVVQKRVCIRKAK
jgi:hypothetical protein